MNRSKQYSASSTPDGLLSIDASQVQSQGHMLETINRLFDVYTEGVVFGAPLSAGDHTVITASEVNVGMGIGFGSGSGTDDQQNGGGGGGGGGASAGRPVAAIIISPRGVEVEPIVDVTKVALAFFTMLGAIFISWRAMQRTAKR